MDDYSGVRVDSEGGRFMINKATGEVGPAVAPELHVLRELIDCVNN